MDRIDKLVDLLFLTLKDLLEQLFLNILSRKVRKVIKLFHHFLNIFNFLYFFIEFILVFILVFSLVFILYFGSFFLLMLQFDILLHLFNLKSFR